METDFDDPSPHDSERDQATINRHLSMLREHFDAVEIVAVRHVSDEDGTAGMHFGAGNWYARMGAMEEAVRSMRSMFSKPGNDRG